MTTGTAAVRVRAPRWLTAAWILLVLIGLFDVFASVTGFTATANTGPHSDHTGTFTKLSGTSCPPSKRARRPGELHDAAGALLRPARADIRDLVSGHPGVRPRAPQRWTCWALLIALGYTLTIGARDPAILPRSLIGTIGLPVLLLVCAPGIPPPHPDDLKQTCGDDRTDPDKDQTSQELATLAGLSADPAAQLEAGQGHGHANEADHDGRKYEADMEGAQRRSRRRGCLCSKPPR